MGVTVTNGVVLGSGLTFSTSSGITPPSGPGRLWSWGSDSNGQLGLNSNIARSSPVLIAATSWNSFGCGQTHAVAVTTTGTLWCWGNNNKGQLGQNNLTDRSQSVQVGVGTNWLEAGVGGYNISAATRTDGTLWMWGSNNNGQLGLNNTIDRSSPVQVGSLTNWSKVACGGYHTLAVKTDGTLWAWGSNSTGQLGLNLSSAVFRSSPVQVGAGTNWSQVATFSGFNLAIKTDGTLWAWGSNTHGQLGLGDTINRSSPVQVGAGTNWLNASVDVFGAAVTKTDYSMWVWGRNHVGQLGLNDTNSRSSPVQLGSLTNWFKPAVGYRWAVAVKTDGSLWAVGGAVSAGQLPINDSLTVRSSPIQVGSLLTWIEPRAGSAFGMARRQV